VKELSACPQPAAQYVRGAFRGALVDPRSQQRLEFVGDDPFVVISLDHSTVEWDTGKRPDGVLIVELDGVTWVCFVEMKGKLREERAFAQLKGGAEHFGPSSRAGGRRSHGDEHHDAWAAAKDLVSPLPSKGHRVIGLFVTFRAVARIPPRPPALVAGRPIAMRAVNVPKKKPNRAEIDPRKLLREAGVL
jgi:hypothetical protein